MPTKKVGANNRRYNLARILRVLPPTGMEFASDFSMQEPSSLRFQATFAYSFLGAGGVSEVYRLSHMTQTQTRINCQPYLAAFEGKRRAGGLPKKVLLPYSKVQ
jgi:hypothetical protein